MPRNLGEGIDTGGALNTPAPPPPLLPAAPAPLLIPPGDDPAIAAAAGAAARAAAAAAAAIIDAGGDPAIAAALEAQASASEAVQNLLNLGTIAALEIDTTGSAAPTSSSGDPFLDSLDVPDGYEGGEAPDQVTELSLEQEADALDAGEPVLLSVKHPAPGTIIGVPYEGTHAKAFNIAGGSDNWQSENAVDIWLTPGTAILAVEAGTISPGGYGYGLSQGGGRFAGWRLHLVTRTGKVFFYTHLRQLVAVKGAKVAPGEIIGYSGTANGVPHLHFAVTPPWRPQAFAGLAYNKKIRTKLAPSPAPAAPPVKPPAGVLSTWRDLVDVFKTDVPRAHGKLKADAASLVEVFK